MLSEGDKSILEENITTLQNARLIKGFYPEGITIGTGVSKKDAITYLETIGVEKFNLKRRYVLYDENVNLVGIYDNLEDVPKDTYVENTYGQEVYVSEDQFIIQYTF